MIEAVKWYRKAAEQGFPEAQYGLGVCYANGDGVPKNYMEAYKWMNLGLAQNFELAGGHVEKAKNLFPSLKAD
jgi:TPR repeat protein